VVAYTYFGYPLTLLLLPRRRPLPPTGQEPPPRVSLLIAAYDEERQIAETLENKLALDYPADRLEIIVVSDGSSDRTDEIVCSFASRGVTLIRQEPRQGKTMALNLARERASGEIVAFSDANSLWDRQALRRLVAPFAAPEVGYVTGELRYRDPGESVSAAACGAYMRYENWVRTIETRVGSIVGVNGGIDAVRRALYAPMRSDHLPDFILPLRVVEQAFRVVFAPAALSVEEALAAPRDEFRMRVRVSLRAYHALAEMKHLLAPGRGLYALQLLVHKVLRYAVGVLMLVALAANLWLVSVPLYRGLLVVQGLFYAAAALGRFFGDTRSRGLVRFPYYFTLVNAAATVALYRFVRGERQVVWAPRKGR
jgi:cellulose synthase/poly-beta-1,6-N-acetylglucosamine synthase-like glycosyltransferase